MQKHKNSSKNMLNFFPLFDILHFVSNFVIYINFFQCPDNLLIYDFGDSLHFSVLSLPTNAHWFGKVIFYQFPEIETFFIRILAGLPGIAWAKILKG